MASSKQVVGNPTPRVEGELKVSGEARYAVDITLPGMLWGKLLRSPIASGKIKRIDTQKAHALAGVHAVITGADCTGLKIGRRLYDMPLLADGEVRFIGEKVAAVAAETEEIAEEAINLIEVEYDETEPLLDPVEALKPDAKLIHPDVVGYKGLPKPLSQPTNDFIYVTWGKGDLETGFRQADIIVENTFTTPVVHHTYIEPHSCVVSTTADGSADCSFVPQRGASDIGSIRRHTAAPIFSGCAGSSSSRTGRALRSRSRMRSGSRRAVSSMRSWRVWGSDCPSASACRSRGFPRD